MFNSSLDSRLDAILEDAGTTKISGDAFRNLTNVSTELEQSKKRVAELEREMRQVTDRLCGGLALGVRRVQPSLHAQLGAGWCKVGYLRKSLTFRPDLNRMIWDVESGHSRFVSRFRRRYAHLLHLTDNLLPLANAVAEFFTNFYRTLGEDGLPVQLTGQGSVVLVEAGEQRRISLGQLGKLVQAKDRHLSDLKTDQW